MKKTIACIIASKRIRDLGILLNFSSKEEKDLYPKNYRMLPLICTLRNAPDSVFRN